MVYSAVEADLVGTEERFGREYVVQRETYRDDRQSLELRFLYRQDRGGLYNADPETMAGAEVASRSRDAERLASVATMAQALRGDPDAARRAYREVLLRVLEKHDRIRDLALRGRVLAQTRAGAARPGPLEGEIALLRYPLHPHRSWRVREDPLVVYTVEGQETLELPAGLINGWRIRIDWPGFLGPGDHVHVWYGRRGFLKLLAHVEGPAVDETGNPYGRVVSDELQVLAALSLVGNGRRRIS